jgi:hypothetical protein
VNSIESGNSMAKFGWVFEIVRPERVNVKSVKSPASVFVAVIVSMVKVSATAFLRAIEGKIVFS